MNRPFLVIAALLAGGATAHAYTPEQAGLIQCVAQLSIVASQQQAGVSSALVYPPLETSGARFAQVVGERLMADARQSREQVRDAFVAGVAAEQKRATAGGGARDIPRDEIIACVALMEKTAPAPPPPTLPQCAGMVKLAYDEVHGREGLSKSAKDMATIAAVLEARARDGLLADGNSQGDADRILTQTRETIAKDVARREADGVSAGLDIQPCFDMAME
ncbi:hypothetical protein [Sphingobium boeckii]|uniref:Uncharacterized protein n=1 Tax=Sphingobium boeckii TaxID=1082345 RepID=A0A7W9EEJ2_9SPHN|nr:hypothetical protein [Sphingobium boeckii]MBB5686237.1 hypothetical protein [Sphingobium boeckii]